MISFEVEKALKFWLKSAPQHTTPCKKAKDKRAKAKKGGWYLGYRVHPRNCYQTSSSNTITALFVQTSDRSGERLHRRRRTFCVWCAADLLLCARAKAGNKCITLGIHHHTPYLCLQRMVSKAVYYRPVLKVLAYILLKANIRFASRRISPFIAPRIHVC